LAAATDWNRLLTARNQRRYDRR